MAMKITSESVVDTAFSPYVMHGAASREGPRAPGYEGEPATITPHGAKL